MSITFHVNCAKCATSQVITLNDASGLVSNADNGKVSITCPKCHNSIEVPAITLACVSCHVAFSVAVLALGSTGVCPHCSESLSFPTVAELKRLNKGLTSCRWIVLPASGEPVKLSGRTELINAIEARRFAAEDLCRIHQFARPIKLRVACDRVFQIRKLYDPKGAYEGLFKTIAGFSAVMCGLICAFVLVALVDPLSWPGESQESSVLKLVVAAVLLIIGGAIGYVPVAWVASKLRLYILNAMTLRPKIDWS